MDALSDRETAGQDARGQVAFEHPFFRRFADSRFQISASDAMPVYVVDMGDQTVALPLAGIRQALGLGDDSEDARMLDAVSRSLRYVKSLRPGDAIPREVVSGEASWDPGHRHREAARRRVTAQVVGWSRGDAAPGTDAAALQCYVDACADDEAVRLAHRQLCAALGYGPERVGDLARMVERMAGELAYIEALRERVSAIVRIGTTVKGLRRKFADQPSMTGEIDPIVRLIAIPLREMLEVLETIDVLICDPLEVLGDFDATCRSLRFSRNELHADLLDWDETIDAWRSIAPQLADPFAMMPLLRDLYRFLASRFAPADEWTLLVVNGVRAPGDRLEGSAKTWFDAGGRGG